MLPTKFGISFTFKPMNQAGALVSIFLDGSVSVAHGGVEMGQGLHTKMCQVAAAALKVPLQVHPVTPCRGCSFMLQLFSIVCLRFCVKTHKVQVKRLGHMLRGMQSVHIAETSTDKVPNSSPTAASASSDLCASIPSPRHHIALLVAHTASFRLRI